MLQDLVRYIEVSNFESKWKHLYKRGSHKPKIEVLSNWFLLVSLIYLVIWLEKTHTFPIHIHMYRERVKCHIYTLK